LKSAGKELAMPWFFPLTALVELLCAGRLYGGISRSQWRFTAQIKAKMKFW
jgi:hypothetical protein